VKQVLSHPKAPTKMSAIEAHHIKKGSDVMMKGVPCKVLDIRTSKTGKHGHAKVVFRGFGKDGKCYNDVRPGHASLPLPQGADAIWTEEELKRYEEAKKEVK
jgi:hypothetical protein